MANESDMFLDITPTKAGVAHVRKLFRETFKSSRSKIADAEKRLDGETDPLLVDALEALVAQEEIRASHMRAALLDMNDDLADLDR